MIDAVTDGNPVRSFEAAHKKASDEMACLSDGTLIDPTVFDWDPKIRSNLTEAACEPKCAGETLRTKPIQ
jgi:hypothetical protein